MKHLMFAWSIFFLSLKQERERVFWLWVRLVHSFSKTIESQTKFNVLNVLTVRINTFASFIWKSVGSINNDVVSILVFKIMCVTIAINECWSHCWKEISLKKINSSDSIHFRYSQTHISPIILLIQIQFF